MQVCGAGLLCLAFFLRNEQDELVSFDSGVDRCKRWLPAYEQRDDYIWKDYDIAERENGDAGFGLHLLAVTREFVSQFSIGLKR